MLNITSLCLCLFIFLLFPNQNEEVDEAIVSVIEIISISETDDCKQINLIPGKWHKLSLLLLLLFFLLDPVARNNYSIQTSSSIYYVHLPWISNLENYTPDGKCRLFILCFQVSM